MTIQYLYEVIYTVQGANKWISVQAENPVRAIEKLEAKYEGNEVQILNMQKSFVADAAALLQ